MAFDAAFLKSFSLSDTLVEGILAAHADDLAAMQAEQETLRQEASAHRTAAEQLRSELDAFRLEVHQERVSAGREEALRTALRTAGANEQAIPLLMKATATSEDDWNGTELANVEALIGQISASYPGFFSVPESIPTTRVTPPIPPTEVLTPDALRQMSANEINRLWPQVRNILGVPR